MNTFRLVLKNYRCFSDEAPLAVDIGAGFTALVGPNNSGKSTLLRFFREMRNVIGLLANPGHLQTLAAQQSIGTSAEQIEDNAELGHNRNNRPLTIEFWHPAPAKNDLSLVRLHSNRGNESTWHGELFHGPERQRLVRPAVVSGQPGFVNEAGNELIVDYSWLINNLTALVNGLYIGPFRNAISENTGNYYELAIGTAFIELWAGWKTGPNRQQNATVQQVEREIAAVFGYDRLEINASSDRKTLHVVANDRPFRLRELGSGLAQFILVLTNVAIRRPAYVFIDEPELSLHPSLQLAFLNALGAYASHGVIFATHSLGLARTSSDRVYSFLMDGDKRLVRPLDSLTNLAEFLGEMSFSAFRELGTGKLLLVEGVHEIRTVQQFLRKIRKERSVVLFPLGGSQLIRRGVQHELDELRRLSPDMCVLIDSERATADEALSPERQGFVDECTALGIPVHVTERRAMENYLSERAVRATKGDKYSALGPFELLASATQPWAKHENWKIASAMEFNEIAATDLGQFLEGL